MTREELEGKLYELMSPSFGGLISETPHVSEIMDLIDEYTKPKKKTKSLEEKAQMLIIDQNKVQLFSRWLKYRKNLKKTIKVQETLDRLAKKFNDTDIETIRQVVNHSIDNQYQGLFWDKFKNNGTTTKQTRIDAFKDVYKSGEL